MSGYRALAWLRAPETGESCSFGVLFGRNKNTTMAEETVRSLRSAETVSSKSPETIAWLILVPETGLGRGEQGRSGLARTEKPRTRENPGPGEKNDCVVCTQ